MPEVTWVLKDVCVCDNCGAHAKTEVKIRHFKSCKQGESKKWEEIYEKANSEEDLT